jgi:hypothetical protein
MLQQGASSGNRSSSRSEPAEGLFVIVDWHKLS